MINLEQIEQLMASGNLMCADANGNPFPVTEEMKLEFLNHLNQSKKRINTGSNYTKPKKRKKNKK